MSKALHLYIPHIQKGETYATHKLGIYFNKGISCLHYNSIIVVLEYIYFFVFSCV